MKKEKSDLEKEFVKNAKSFYLQYPTDNQTVITNAMGLRMKASAVETVESAEALVSELGENIGLSDEAFEEIIKTIPYSMRVNAVIATMAHIVQQLD